MTVRGFFLTMGAGVAVGALGAMMLPKNSDAYRMTKQAAKAIQNEAEKASRRREANFRFGGIGQNAFTAAVSAARALRYQPR